MTSLTGHRSLFLHQYDQLAETSIAAICQTVTQIAHADVVIKKVADGKTLMGAAIDRDPLAFTGAQDVATQAAAYAQEGVDLIPWVNPLDHTDADFHAQFGDRLVVDLEPYARFWQDTPEHVPLYLQRLRQLGVREILVSIDPRTAAAQTLAVQSWIGMCDAVLPQLYFTDFGQPASAMLPLMQHVAGYGVEQIPVFPQAGYADFAATWQGAQALGAAGVSLWKLGDAGPAALQAFAALPVAAAKPVFDAAARLALIGYIAHGSGVGDVTAWIAGYRDA